MTSTIPERITPTGILVLSADASREEWLAARRQGIGGSDALAVLGLNPYASRYSVWAEKSGLLKNDEDREAMQWGRLLEPVIAAEFTERTGIATTVCGLMRHADREWQLASVDRLTEDGGVLEIKTTSAYRAAEWDDDQIADAAEAQLQHYLAVTGLPHGYAAVLIGGQRLEIRRVERDERLIRVLVEAEEELWQMVQDGTPPALDGSEATARALAQIHGRAEVGRVVELDDRAVTLLRESLELAAEIKAMEERRAAVRNEITAVMGDATEAVHGGQVVAAWRPTGRFDAERFATDHPEVAQEFTRTVEVIDERALRAAHPDLYARYRARVFRPVKKGLIDGS